MPDFGVGRGAFDASRISGLCGPRHAMSMTLNICSRSNFYEHVFWTYVHKLI